MKNFSLLSVLMIAVFGVMTSCSSSDDCHDCHIALFDAAGQETAEVEIGEFCGDALEDVESAGYQLTEMLVADNGDTLQPGLYTDVHCEEHADHDH